MTRVRSARRRSPRRPGTSPSGSPCLQSAGLVYVFHNGAAGLLGSTSSNIDLIPHFTLYRAGFICLTLTAGTAFVMWLGELITQRGIGNGMSIIIFANVVAGRPGRRHCRLVAGWEASSSASSWR